MTNVIAGVALGAALAMVSASAWALTPLTNIGVLTADESLSGSVVLTDTGSSLTYKFSATSVEPVVTFTQSGSAVDLGFEFEVVGTPLTLTYASTTNNISSGTKALIGSPYTYIYDVTTSSFVTPTATFGYDSFANSYISKTTSVTLDPGTYIDYLVGTAAKGKTNIYDGVFAGDALSVPEPGVWALMLGGIAMMGAALRLGRKQVARAVA